VKTRNRGYKTELKVNKSQKQLLEQHCGSTRFTYDWGLNLKIKDYSEIKILKEKIASVSGKERGELEKELKAREKLNAISLHRKINSLKKVCYPWMYQVSKCAPQEALRDLDKAYQSFFRRAKSKVEAPGFPKFKSKHDSKKSFRLTGTIKVLSNGYIQLPRLGVLKLKEKGYFPEGGIKILSASVSSRAGRWFVAIQVEEEILFLPKFGISSEVIGIDLGIKELAVASNSMRFENPKALKSNLESLKRLSKKHSRKKKNSNSKKKSASKLAKLHYKISNIRKDSIHKMTTTLAKAKPRSLVIEDLAVKNMIKNRRLSRCLADTSFGEIRRQFEYKSKWFVVDLMVVDRWFPSSKTCSSCGNKKDKLKLSERVYNCTECGLSLCRDLNASYNLRNYYLDHCDPTSSSGGSNACGDEAMASSMKQEIESRLSCTA